MFKIILVVLIFFLILWLGIKIKSVENQEDEDQPSYRIPAHVTTYEFSVKDDGHHYFDEELNNAFKAQVGKEAGNLVLSETSVKDKHGEINKFLEICVADANERPWYMFVSEDSVSIDIEYDSEEELEGRIENVQTFLHTILPDYYDEKIKYQKLPC